jgi:hypothetical protein
MGICTGISALGCPIVPALGSKGTNVAVTKVTGLVGKNPQNPEPEQRRGEQTQVGEESHDRAPPSLGAEILDSYARLGL